MVNKRNLAITLYSFVETVISLQIRNYSVDMQINRPSYKYLHYVCRYLKSIIWVFKLI